MQFGLDNRLWLVDHAAVARRGFATHKSRATHVYAVVSASAEPVVTFQQLQAAAAARFKLVTQHRDLALSVKELGPFYRVVCRQGCDSNRAHTGNTISSNGSGPSSSAPGRILAVTSGFAVTPLGLLHCDTMQVFTKSLKGEEGFQDYGGAFGLGLLVMAAALAWGASKGCRKAELLAINDDDTQHRRLVRYYRYFGAVPVRVVGEGNWTDIPDQLVWGGVGTRMDADIAACLKRWGPVLVNAPLQSTKGLI